MGSQPEQAAEPAGDSSIGRRRAAARGGGGPGYQARRGEIVAAAAEVFRARGYRRSSLADVAEAVGVDRASLYYYVGSKEELFDEIVTGVVEANLAVAEQVRDEPAPAPDKLRRLVRQLMRSYADHYPFLYVYLQEDLAHVAPARQPWAERMRAVNRRYEAAVEAMVEQGVQEGTLRPLTRSRVLAFGLMGTVSWTSRWFNPATSPVDADTIGDVYARLLLDGLERAPEPAGPEPLDRAGPDATTSPAPRAAPDVARLAERFRAAGVPTYDTLAVPEARELLEGVRRLQHPPEPLAEVRDVLVDGAAGRLPARVYVPQPGAAAPVVVYLHGGGFVLGSLAAADGPCRRLAAASGCVVVSVAYRLAPETPFPGPLDDCVAAVRWVAAHRAELGGGERLVLMGDSAGGNLAAAAALDLRDTGGPAVDAQVLLYPCLAPARDSPYASYRRQADGPLMTRAELLWFWDHYLRDGRDAADPRAAPLLAEDLSGLPPATVVVAELDPLRDEGLAYASRLRQAGVDVQVREVAGAAHGFWWMDRVLAQADELTAALVPVLRGNNTHVDPYVNTGVDGPGSAR